ncbi:MAG: hypothetical protein AB7S26_24990 [Sandaracinaceae bacterium]
MRSALFVLALASTTALLTSPVEAQLPYPSLEEGHSAHDEPASRPQRHPARFLILAGGAMLGGFYAGNALVGVFAGGSICFVGPSCGGGSSDWDTFRVLGAVPLAGPWLQLATKPTALGEDDWAAFLISMGIAQLAGAALLIAGLVWITDGDEEDATDVAISVVPSIGPEQIGLSMLGSF